MDTLMDRYAWTYTKWYPLCDKETPYNTKFRVTFYYAEEGPSYWHRSSKIATIMVTKRPQTILSILHVAQIE